MFTLSCGDVMPGCPARFEANDTDSLMGQVAHHAAERHGLTDITPETAQAISAQIVRVA